MARRPAADGAPSILSQPKQVWAVGFACVVAFMGIGLVDPILPAIAEGMDATPTETELLFTSYLLITGVAMLFTSWISSRIGAKRTLMIGLGLIVAFALLAGLSTQVEAIIGFRAGWGLGNALFVSTALATIVGAASGGGAAAIILYEAALGLGIAIGPLLGGLLGTLHWSGPFFGTAALMAIAFVAILVLFDREETEPRIPTKLSAPIRALANPRLLVLAMAALFYNVGFFILLAYTPFPLHMNAIGLGFVFFGWGVGLAVTSVWVAPLITARMPHSSVLAAVLPLLALDLVAAGVFVSSQLGLVIAVIVGGLLLGVLNTVFTESVMEGTGLPRSVASSSYSAVRFLGAAAAPPLATVLAELFTPGMPYFVGAASVLVATAIVILGARRLVRPAAAVATPATPVTVGEPA
jgi:MFS transporter, ACDE family, multidrug resistance protein